MKNTYKKSDSNSKDATSKKSSPKFSFKFLFLTNSIAKTRAFIENKTFQRVFGSLFLLTSIYLLIAFSSFIFTWKSDQDKLMGSWTELLFNPDIIVDNWLGKIGAIIAHQFIHNWFGMPSFLFVLISFMIGFRILFKINLLPFEKTIKHSIFILLWTSAFLGYFFTDKIYLGGGIGFYLNNWFTSVLGSIGTGFFLAFIILIFAFVVYSVEVDKLVSFFTNPDPISDEELAEEQEKISSIQQYDNLKENIVDLSENEEDLQPEIIENKKDTLETEFEIETPNNEPSEQKTSIFIDELEIETNPTPPTSTNDDTNDLDVEIEDTTENDDQLSDEDVDKNLKDFGEYDPKLELGHYKHPTIDLLADHGDGKAQVNREELEENKNKIVQTLGHYKIEIEKIKATIGPTVTLYEIIPAPGVRISKIKNLEDDIALSLAALGIRIIAPIPGKGTIGIEVPNSNPDVVSMRAAIASERFQTAKMELPVALGKTIQNETFVADLAKMPHLLIAGATGQGKSVGINAILTSLLYKKHPSQLKFVMVDPKMVELSIYGKIEKHFLAKLPDSEKPILTDSKKVTNTLNSLVIEMENRLKLCEKAHARNIIEYNNKFIKRRLNPNNGHMYLPYIVVLIDEFADFIMEAGKEIETPIARLAQKARAIGIHLIIATQRPSATVITGLIKANFPARIAFRVSSKIDSRVILDAGGADQLIGRGDMLYSAGQDLIRIQCAFVDTPEVEDITAFIGDQQGYPSAHELPEYIDENAPSAGGGLDDDERDELFEEAARVIVMHQQGSASLLQRKLKLGYNRAGRLIDQLEAAGVVGPHEGSKARQVLYPDEYSLEQFLNASSNNNNEENS